ncbi:MAG: helix-turn-helix transcriptional regulator [Aerococcaceae bacterium]|nr:helix-turn-helix transcriptional regulator [Aerococcaceae bacterium]
MEVDKKSVGLRIKSIRQNLGKTMEEFGSMIECPAVKPGIISRWESGISLPNAERLKSIAKIGNIPVNELLYGTFISQQLEWAEELIEKMGLTPEEKERVWKEIKSTVKINHLLEPLFPKLFDAPRVKQKFMDIIIEEQEIGARTDKNAIKFLCRNLNETVRDLQIYIDSEITQNAISQGKISLETEDYFNDIIRQIESIIENMKTTYPDD